jgi:glycosyltransferase involved in cell wall biosynthesis
MKLGSLIKQIQDKAVILNPGIDFNGFPEPDICKRDTDSPPVIVWNHRWEHDKNPEYFFNTLYELDKRNVNFGLIVLGQSFQRRPDIFDEARERLSHKTLHFGYVESRQEYIRLLCKADIVVSTARHEFYGISVIEAVRAGCIPVLPNRLSYPELFPVEYLYEKGGLYTKLESLLKVSIRPDNPKARALTERFSWSELKDNYIEWFKV